MEWGLWLQMRKIIEPHPTADYLVICLCKYVINMKIILKDRCAKTRMIRRHCCSQNCRQFYQERTKEHKDLSSKLCIAFCITNRALQKKSWTCGESAASFALLQIPSLTGLIMARSILIRAQNNCVLRCLLLMLSWGGLLELEALNLQLF